MSSHDGAGDCVDGIRQPQHRCGGGAELRVDSSDGCAYPLSSFLAEYGAKRGKRIWDGSLRAAIGGAADIGANGAGGGGGSGGASGGRGSFRAVPVLKRTRLFSASSSGFATFLPCGVFAAVLRYLSDADVGRVATTCHDCGRRCEAQLRWRR